MKPLEKSWYELGEMEKEEGTYIFVTTLQDTKYNRERMTKMFLEFLQKTYVKVKGFHLEEGGRKSRADLHIVTNCGHINNIFREWCRVLHLILNKSKTSRGIDKKVIIHFQEQKERLVRLGIIEK